MELVIHLADTEDWANLNDVESYLSQMNVRGIQWAKQEEEDRFKSNVRRWSEQYRPSYMMFRHLFKQICISNHAKFNLPITVAKPSSFNSNQIVLITDDDDIFNPLVVEEVRKAFADNPHLDMVYWDTWLNLMTEHKQRFEIYRNSLIGSNGMAVRGGLSPWLYTWGAHIKAEAMIPQDKRMYIQKPMSVWNIHPASFWQRSNYLLPEGFNVLQKTEVPPEIEWAREYIDKLYEVLVSITCL
jgi:hypothetical protein